MFISKYNIRTVPRLVVCNPDGAAITYKGRSEVESKLAAAIYNWIDTKPVKPTTNELVSIHNPNLRVILSLLLIVQCNVWVVFPIDVQLPLLRN